jgi:cullin-associated NEDD8-dissociated protein 1
VAALVAGANDSTWKVRRAAVGVLSAFIRARSDILKDYYNDLCDHLVERFKERDSAVKEDILLCCRDLLRESVVSNKDHVESNEESKPVPTFTRTRSSYETLDLKVKSIVSGVEKQLRTADARTQRAVFAVLTELVVVRHGNMGEYLSQLIPHIIKGIESGNDVTADALKLTHLMLETHKYEELQEFFGPLAVATIKAIRSGQAKNIPDALGVLASISKIIANKNPSTDQSSIATSIFQIVYEQLQQKDVPLDVKLSSIYTMSVVLSAFGSVLKQQVALVLPVYAERMGNETTVQPVLRAITKISNSQQNLDLKYIAHRGEEIVVFIRQASTPLKHDTVKCLESLLRNHADCFTTRQIAMILTEIAAFINENDLQLSHFVLDLCSSILKYTPPNLQILQQVSGDILQRAIRFSCSPLLQGASLTSLINFFQQFIQAQAKTSGNSFSSLLTSLLNCVKPDLNKQAFSALAKCIAAITIKATDQQLRETVNRFTADIKPNAKPHNNQIGLLFLGEMGKQRDLAEFKNIELVILNTFDNPDEGVRSAAAFALGNIAVGNLGQFLPELLKLIQSKPEHGYLLFSALKEIISTFSVNFQSMEKFRPYLDSVIPLLFNSAESKNDATRDMVSECIGRLAIFNPQAILSRMLKLLSSSSANVRVVGIAGLRFAFTPLMDWAVLQSHLANFFALVKDSDLEVRRQTLLTMNSLFRANIEVVQRDVLTSLILPALYEETKPKLELIHEVDYGAFKKTIDDGKPLRKAAFQCLGTLLDVSSHRLNMQEYIKYIQSGLADAEDIQITTYQLFTDLGQYHGSSMLEVLDSMPKLIMGSVKSHIAAAKTKEPEVALECLRALMRAMIQWNTIPGVELCGLYTHFFKQVCATPILAQMLKEMQAAK